MTSMKGYGNDDIVILYNDLYDRKASRKLNSTLSLFQKSDENIRDTFRDSRMTLNEIRNMYLEVDYMSNEYLEEITRNLTLYLKGIRSKFIYKLIKFIIRAKYILWIFIWYLFM